MKHETDDRNFWPAYWSLPSRIQDAADRQYDLLKKDPDYPSVEFKKLCDTEKGQIWSARVNDNYRALALRVNPETYVWFWIGEHDEYERKIGYFC